MDLNKKIADAGGVYKRFAPALSKLGIITFSDFLFHYPFRYDDFTLVSSISQIQEGETVTIKGEVTQIRNIFTRSYKKIQKAKIKDSSGEIDIIWFNQPFITRTIQKGDLVSLSGIVDRNIDGFILNSPEYEKLNDLNDDTIHTGRLVPVYPETRGISSKWMRRQIKKILDNPSSLFEYLPKKTLESNKLLPFDKAVSQIHFPKDLSDAEAAKERLKFDELLIVQSRVILRKREWEKKAQGRRLEVKKHEQKIEKFKEDLPFELTPSQTKAVEEIFKDLDSETAMNRLLEGDVGSGKTIVAAISMYLAYLNGIQSALIAPTEILATQHHKTISSLLSSLGVKTELITRSNKIKEENFDILIGTHALISDKVKFKDLGLIIIDEQQHFGVEQRATLRKKGNNPHLLTMTATPIPRTVALTVYGDLSLTLLTDMPKNRKKIKTWLVPPVKRSSGYKWIEKEIKENKSQAFIICPFIEESESMTTVKAATKEFENLKKIFSDLNVGLLHGKMKTKEKEEVLQAFKEKKIDILVATPIVEVGIDFPNATIIVIEASERFGLAQLHQLRGRVGRGDKQSYCLLFSESTKPESLSRLKAMETLNVGAELAELDLKIRGAGDTYGVRQHGISSLRIADFSDHELLERTRKEAQRLMDEINDHPLLFEKIKSKTSTEVSPD